MRPHDRTVLQQSILTDANIVTLAKQTAGSLMMVWLNRNM